MLLTIIIKIGNLFTYNSRFGSTAPKELVKTKGTSNKPHCGFLFLWRLFVQPYSVKLAIIHSFINGHATELLL